MLDQLFAAIEMPDQWPSALRSMGTYLSSDHAFAHIVSPTGVTTHVSRGSEEALEVLLTDSWHERNPRMVRGLQFARQGTKELWTDWRLFSPEEIAADPFEQEYATKHDCAHFAGTFIPVDADTFLVLDFDRSARHGAYQGNDLRKIEHLLDISATSIGYALKVQQSAIQSMIDIEAKACAWTDADGRLLACLPSFEELTGRFVGTRGNRVRALGGDTEGFQLLIDAAGQGERPNMVVRLANPVDQADAAVARAGPVSTLSSRLTGRSQVMLTIEVTQVQHSVLDLLRGRYGLTPAEVRLTMHLASGMSLRDAGNEENITYEAARTRLKLIFHKLSVSRQGELVSKLSRL